VGGRRANAVGRPCVTCSTLRVHMHCTQRAGRQNIAVRAHESPVFPPASARGSGHAFASARATRVCVISPAVRSQASSLANATHSATSSCASEQRVVDERYSTRLCRKSPPMPNAPSITRAPLSIQPRLQCIGGCNRPNKRYRTGKTRTHIREIHTAALRGGSPANARARPECWAPLARAGLFDVPSIAPSSRRGRDVSRVPDDA